MADQPTKPDERQEEEITIAEAIEGAQIVHAEEDLIQTDNGWNVGIKDGKFVLYRES